MGLFHFSKRRLVNEKKPFKKESLWYKAMDEACTVHQTRTLVERMKRVTNSQVKPIIIRKTPQYSGFGHCSLCDMIVSRKWKWKWKCKQEITTRTLSILYSVFTINHFICCSCYRKWRWYNGKKALMPVQHRPCNNFIGSGTGLQNCRGRRLALHQCVRSVSSPANNSFQAIRTSMTSLYNKTVDDSCHKSHRIPKFLWTFQNQIITLWNWN